MDLCPSDAKINTNVSPSAGCLCLQECASERWQRCFITLTGREKKHSVGFRQASSSVLANLVMKKKTCKKFKFIGVFFAEQNVISQWKILKNLLFNGKTIRQGKSIFSGTQN